MGWICVSRICIKLSWNISIRISIKNIFRISNYIPNRKYIRWRFWSTILRKYCNSVLYNKCNIWYNIDKRESIRSMIFLIDGSINEDLMYFGLISIAFIVRAMLVKKGIG